VGEAKRGIAGLSLSNANYKVVIQILRERFGNKQDVIDLHYQSLVNIATPSVTVGNLRIFLNTVEKHLRSLEVIDENINQHVFVSIIRAKLTEEVLRQLEFSHGSKDQWTLQTLVRQISEYVTACERADKRDTHARYLPARENHVDSKPRPVYSRDQNPMTYREPALTFRSTTSAGALTTNDKGVHRLKQSCRYCGERHWSDECRKFRTVEDRKRQIRGSCYRCLMEGHGSQDCIKRYQCVHCKATNNHHRSLCPKKFGVIETNTHLTEEVQEQECPSSLESESANEQVIVSSDEMVLMQTAKTDIFNPESNSFESRRLILDSGSQR